MTTPTSHAELVCVRMHHLMILEDIWSVNIIAQVNSSSRGLLLLVQFKRVDGLMAHSIDIFMSIPVGVRTILCNLIPWWWIRQSNHTVSGLQWGSKIGLWLHIVKIFWKNFFAGNARISVRRTDLGGMTSNNQRQFNPHSPKSAGTRLHLSPLCL